jgi:hypothetical protein
VSEITSGFGRFSVGELVRFQRVMEERLSARLKLASAREEILSGFIFMKPMDAATRRQVEIYIRVMAINEQAGEISFGPKDQRPEMIAFLSEAEDLYDEFMRLEPQAEG